MDVSPASDESTMPPACVHKSLIKACRLQPLKDLDSARWNEESILERDQENCSCLHALTQRAYPGEPQSSRLRVVLAIPVHLFQLSAFGAMCCCIPRCFPFLEPIHAATVLW